MTLMDGMSWLIGGAILALILQVLDVITTMRALENGGREANPIIRWMMEVLPGPGWIIFKLTLGVGFIYLLFMYGPLWAIWALNGLYVWVVLHNWKVGTPR